MIPCRRLIPGRFLQGRCSTCENCRGPFTWSQAAPRGEALLRRNPLLPPRCQRSGTISKRRRPSHSGRAVGTPFPCTLSAILRSFLFFPFCRSIGEAGKLSCHEGRPPSGRLPRSTNETRKKDPLPLASKLREPPHNTRRRFIVAVPSHRRPSAPKEGYKRLQS